MEQYHVLYGIFAEKIRRVLKRHGFYQEPLLICNRIFAESIKKPWIVSKAIMEGIGRKYGTIPCII